MSVALGVLLVGLLMAGVSAAIGVAAATVSQHELTRWVAYKLRGSAATVNVLKNPGQTLATSNMLTTLGVLLAAGAIPALLAATTPTFLGIFTIAVGAFMIFYYLFPGLVAVLAVLAHVLLTFALMSFINGTFTLPIEDHCGFNNESAA